MNTRRTSPTAADRRQAALGLALLLMLALAAWNVGRLPPLLAGYVANIASSGQSVRDLERETQNYYEVLMDVDHVRWMSGGIMKWMAKLFRETVETTPGENWVRIKDSDLVILQEDAFLEYVLKPDHESIYMGVPVRTNRWGMRDRERELAKPPGTFRIALVGSSNDMGYGVEQERIYPVLLEDRLTAELGGGAFERYEVLNFSVGGYALLQRLYVTDHQVPAFDPDLIIVVATMHDLRWQIYERLVQRTRHGLDLHYDFLEKFVADAGVEPGQSGARIRQRLRPRREALARMVFEELHRIGEREGAPVVLTNFRLRVDPVHPDMLRQSELARTAGLPTLEIFDAYEGRKDTEMYLSPSDAHPTAAAHALLAEELYTKMLADTAIRALLLGESPPQPEKPHAH